MTEFVELNSEEQIASYLDRLAKDTIKSLPYLFELWALDHQSEPPGDWRTWVALGGRGAGKTRAGSEWVRDKVSGPTPFAAGEFRRVGLIGETIEQAREIMIFGESGILQCCPSDRRPRWVASRKALIWPNGAEARIFSAHEPESLRGAQFDCIWADELAKWKRAKEVWDMAQFALRLGRKPRQMVTTTPRNRQILKDIINHKSTVLTCAPTEANSHNLSPGFAQNLRETYAGTRLGRQELNGEFLEEIDGALWNLEQFEQTRTGEVPELDRVVIAVDPPASSHSNSDDCGIIVAGVQSKGEPTNWVGYVLEDASVSAASPQIWARAVVDAFERNNADSVIVEVNNGGEMVEAVLRQQSALLPIKAVRAFKNKQTRSEPIAALYEQRRIHHTYNLDVLETQMTQMSISGFKGSGSPDRVDALVWALTHLILEPAKSFQRPKIRIL